MGVGCQWECPKCEYKFDGYLADGMGCYQYYHETIEKAKQGELGEEFKELFEKYPDATIDTESEIFRCVECGEYGNRSVFDSYIPKEGARIPPNLDKVTWWPEQRESYYDHYAEYDRRCEKCGGRMVKVSASLYEKGMMCPKCKTPLNLRRRFLWD